ncbi:MAG: hypothetical protein KTR25_09710 [Myxococcales bacterium]|nr:hypothetical protein [Myxococcales bacterium]
MRSLSALLFLILYIVSVPLLGYAQNWRKFMSPGPLGVDHANISGSCDKCHLMFKGIPDEKCLDCHTVIEELRLDNTGFHGRFADKPCIECHVDHRGKNHSLVTEKARQAFDHNLTLFALEGGHEELECKDCHDRPLTELVGSCANCHEDPHKSQFGRDCQSCHRALDWDKLNRTRTNHKTRLDGGHRDSKCTDCHEGGNNLKAVVQCAACHEEAHGGTEEPCDNCHSVSGFTPAKFEHDLCPCSFPGKHKEVDCLSCHKDFQFTKTPTLCSGCHLKERPHDPLGECSICHSPLSWTKNKFNHNRQTTFPLENSHLEVDCFRCHTEQKRGKRIFQGSPRICYGCHKDQGVEAHGNFGNCQKCHTTQGFENSHFDHSSTGFEIDGEHQKLNCKECHTDKMRGYPRKNRKGKRRQTSHQSPQIISPTSPEEERSHPSIAKTPVATPQLLSLMLIQQVRTLPKSIHDERACDHCHENPHKNSASSNCTQCHGTDGWRPSTFGLRQHAVTSFPLKGAHTSVKCRLCHVDNQISGQPTKCSQCHLDIHQGQFGEDCTKCHTETAFKPTPKFDHANTGFELIGAHQEVECLLCHGGEGKPDLSKKSETPECATCHLPGHGPELGEHCDQCHVLEEDKKFSEAAHDRFDHNTTTFPIERRHRLLSCGDCHPAAVDGKPPIAPTSRCDNCHMDPHKGNNTTKCGQCHAPDRWRMVRFDHDAAGWPLSGRHAVTPCISCHTGERWFGLTTDCFDCHALDAARGAQLAPANHPFRRVLCTNCHNNRWTWRFL